MPSAQEPNAYQIYLGSFFIGILLYALNIFASIFATLLILFFWGANIILLFVRDKIVAEPLHSTITHYRIYSKGNWFNYTLAVLLAIESLVFVFSPLDKPTTVILCWTFNIFAYPYLAKLAIRNLPRQLVTDYLYEQFPGKPKENLQKAVDILSGNPAPSEHELCRQLGWQEEEVRRLATLYARYVDNNGPIKQRQVGDQSGFAGTRRPNGPLV